MSNKYLVVKSSDLHIKSEQLGKLNLLILLSYKYKILRILSMFFKFFKGIELPSNCYQQKIRLIHPHGVIINTRAEIGNNVTVYQNVTVGSKQFGKKQGAPKIGNDVVIYPNAILIGDIFIGNNSIVGAGAVVVSSFPDNSIIAGNPASKVGVIE
ncbi:serine O-acetyltransferase [Aliiglaciecola lipolytica]|uniref:serine O-acetyltransferase n=1 Tax=Aliiglaciecola lipolytica TaxID=477689 RepID=UPI001C0A36FF|nr:serine acetyltransferase [Aliiglaciecola lipolytica]MBU2880306.1 serine acetyltransferase [Aliiglaciecola lipolytica]